MSSSSEGKGAPGRLRRRLLFGAGLALLLAGAAILTIGAAGYLRDSADDEEPALDAQAIAEMTRLSIDDVEGLPVAIPYYKPEFTTPQPTPTGRPLAAPLRLIIESIGVDAPVLEMGLEEGGIPEVPLNGEDVAWYDFSSKPGAGSNAVFAGHINWAGELGVFGELDKVQPGDAIRLIAQDGREYEYEVTANFAVDPEDPESLKVMAATETDMVTLITCGGTWLPNPSEPFGGNYTNRVIVQGKLVRPSLSAPVPSVISAG